MVAVLAWIGVAVLGALGAVARFRVDSAVSSRLPSDFPLGTLVVNVSGSFALGILVGASLAGDALLVLGTGLMGSYTTFSTWMTESVRLGESGRVTLLLRNLWLSMLLGLGVAAAGYHLGQALA